MVLCELNMIGEFLSNFSEESRLKAVQPPLISELKDVNDLIFEESYQNVRINVDERTQEKTRQQDLLISVFTVWPGLERDVEILKLSPGT